MEHFGAVFKLDLMEETRTQLQEEEAIASSCLVLATPLNPRRIVYLHFPVLINIIRLTYTYYVHRTNTARFLLNRCIFPELLPVRLVPKSQLLGTEVEVLFTGRAAVCPFRCPSNSIKA